MTTAERLRAFLQPAPVVALHCSASSPRQWLAYRELLDPRTVIHTPHLLGYAERQEWVRGAPVTLLEEAHHLHPTLLAAGQPVHLVGHSYGGAVALQAALLWPALVRSLTVYEPTAFHLLAKDVDSVDAAEEIHAVARRVGLLSLSGRGAAAGEVFVDYWSGRGSWAALRASHASEIALRMSKVRAEFEAIFHARFDPRGLEHAGVPLRVVHGDRSPAPARRVAELLRRQVRGADVICLRGQRHMAPVTDALVLASFLFPHAAPLEMLLAA
jgi:pimeloyl-ACP methyl ester carboxylesterase